jgi:hypothetical protein
MAGIVTDCFFIRARNDVLGMHFMPGERRKLEKEIYLWRN